MGEGIPLVYLIHHQKTHGQKPQVLTFKTHKIGTVLVNSYDILLKGKLDSTYSAPMHLCTTSQYTHWACDLLIVAQLLRNVRGRVYILAIHYAPLVHVDVMPHSRYIVVYKNELRF